MKAILKNDNWLNELNAEQKASIERGSKDIEEGKIFTHKEVMAKSRALINKHMKR